MNEGHIKSVALDKALLQSERLRILGVLVLLGTFVCSVIVKVFILRTVDASHPWERGLLFAFTVCGYEYWALHKVNTALKTDACLSMRFWILSTILETSLPAFALAFLSSSKVETAYRPLASPTLLIFFIFIILSTLRLNPWLGVLSGFIASITYLCAALYLGWHFPVFGVPAPVTQYNVTLYADVLLAAGLCAGAVAWQIRKHVQAALREAETQRKLDVVQHELQVARSIQQSLLPQEQPQVNGFDIAGWNQPADDTGGDYFDWKSFPNGNLVVSLADVTGHGIGPALLAAVCHAYARSSFTPTQGLTAALQQINESLATDLTPGRFVTFVAATCCKGCPDVEVLSAGHGPLFIYLRATDEFSEMPAHGLPFGILPDFKPDPPTRLQLHSGDLLLLATDGFFEWENDRGEQFGTIRMAETIRASRDLKSQNIIENLYDAVIKFSSGTRQLDDLTAVVIKRL
jgi:serine phosphatase RsbU (regulator of sigma subunit)